LKKKSAGDVIFLVKSNPNAPSMVFGEQTLSQLEEKKAFVKTVSSSNQTKMESLKKKTIKGEMSTTATVSMAVNVLIIKQALGFRIEKMLKYDRR
jgi:hypothetical protein